VATASTAGCSPTADRIRVSGYVPATEESLREAGWSTDLSRLTVPLDALSKGPPTRHAFPVVTAPEHAPASQLALDPASPVLVVRGDSEVRAWPLAALLDAELVLDEVDGVPVAVTFCSLCGSALVWDRRVEGRSLEFGVSGLLLAGNSLLYDRESESLWRQLDGRAVAGRHAGSRLVAVPSFVVSFGALHEARPEALVMTSSPGRASVRHLTAIDVGSNRAPEWLQLACPNPFDPLLRSFL
jgi:hypothetical protein